MKNIRHRSVNIPCCMLVAYLAMPGITFATDWFTDNPQEQCAKIKQDSVCDCPRSELTPMTGGQVFVEFFEAAKTDPYATYLSGPAGFCPRSQKDCRYYSFSLEGKMLACEDFYAALQAKQKSCNGCLAPKTQLAP